MHAAVLHHGSGIARVQQPWRANARRCDAVTGANRKPRRSLCVRAAEDRPPVPPTAGVQTQSKLPDDAVFNGNGNGAAKSNGASNGDVQATIKRMQGKRKTKVESTDAVATFLTRRFGLAGGFAWLGVLAAGTIGEQIKTRLEVAEEEKGRRDVVEAREVELASGVRYTDMRIGGGMQPAKGDLVVLDYMLSVDGRIVEDTTKRGRPMVFVFGARPFSGGMCEGTEQALASMRAGGRRRVTVPPSLGFPDGTALHPEEQDRARAGVIPPGATLYYDLSLLRVSIAP